MLAWLNVAGYLTPEFVLQVSDRRLVNQQTGDPVDDAANKAVLFCGRHVFGYTGLAWIGNEPTDAWLASVLGSARSLTEAVQSLRDRCTEVFRSLPYPRARKRLAVVGVGWTRPTTSSELVATLTWVTNCLGPQGWLAEAQDAFTAGQELVQDGVKVISAGQRFERERMRRIIRALRRGSQRADGPAIAARMIAMEVRDVAARNQSVGRSLLVSSLPRAAVPAAALMPLGQPEFGNRAMFAYIPADADDPIMYGPATACNGLVTAGVMVSMQPLPPPRLFSPPTSV